MQITYYILVCNYFDFVLNYQLIKYRQLLWIAQIAVFTMYNDDASLMYFINECCELFL